MENLIITSITVRELVDALKQAVSEMTTTESPKKEESKLLSINEVCRIFSVTKPTLLSWRKKGYIQAYRIGSRVYFRQSEIEHVTIKLKKYERQ